MTNTTEPQTATERRLTKPGTPSRIVADEIHLSTGYDEIHCDDLAIKSMAALHEAGLRIVSDATLAAAAYLITFGSEQSELRDVTLLALEADRTEATP